MKTKRIIHINFNLLLALTLVFCSSLTAQSSNLVNLASTQEIFTYTPEHYPRSGSELIGEAYSSRTIQKTFDKE